MAPMPFRKLIVAGVLILGSSICLAEPEVLLRQKVGPLLVSSGEYFALIKETELAPEQNHRRLLFIKKALGSEEAYARQLKKINNSAIDALTEEYMRASDGYLAMVSSWIYFSAIAESRGDKSPPDLINELHLPDGTSRFLPWSSATQVYAWSMSEIASVVNVKAKAVALAGGYKAVFAGKCPIDDGAVEIVQDGFTIEGRRGNKLVLWGRVGERQLYIQLAETKYAEVYGPKEHATTAFPERPSDIYRAEVAADRFAFEGMHYKECTLTLQKPR